MTKAQIIADLKEMIGPGIEVDDSGLLVWVNDAYMQIVDAITSVNANDIGAVAMTTDRKLHVAVMDALPAGTAAIGKLAVG